jgi:arsenate reductase
LLDDAGADYEYREYTQDPLSKTEIKKVLGLLGLGPKDVLRKNDKAYKELGLTGKETDAKLIGHMAEHPTLLQRPIVVLGKKAVVGRPPERVLELVK